MEIWVNKFVQGHDMVWNAEGGRSLQMYNNIGYPGKHFTDVYLGYKRIGRRHVIALNKNREERKRVEKTVGIWISDCDYRVIRPGEIWTGKTADDQIIIGRFGIYNLGAIISCQGVHWKLTKDRGWVVTNE